MQTEIFPTTWNGPNSEYPIADGQHISSFFMHGKFNVTGNFSNGEYILVIKNVTTADQGDYTCDIVVDGKPLQHTVQLELERKMKLKVQYLKKNALDRSTAKSCVRHLQTKTYNILLLRNSTKHT